MPPASLYGDMLPGVNAMSGVPLPADRGEKPPPGENAAPVPAAMGVKAPPSSSASGVNMYCVCPAAARCSSVNVSASRATASRSISTSMRTPKCPVPMSAICPRRMRWEMPLQSSSSAYTAASIKISTVSSKDAR
jgi:hypothetical protein